MGLRCLLGHNFDEPELQREREEDGNEVVTTVTEVKTCARCGETQIVSENTEVTTMEQLTDEATAAETEAADGSTVSGRYDEPEENAADVETDEPESFDVTTDGDDAVIIDDGPDETAAEAAGPSDQSPESARGDGEAVVDESVDGAEAIGEESSQDDGAELLSDTTEASKDTALGGDYEEYPGVETESASVDDERNAEAGNERDDERDAERDDGVILDETSEPEGDRERGAWPEVDGDETPGTEPTPWPEQAGDGEGYSAEVSDGDETGGVEFGGGLTPEPTERPRADDDDTEYVEAPERGSTSETGIIETDGAEADVDVGITRGESPDIGPSTADVTMEYYCPECEMTRDTDGNSMRAGDICPECKRGYVTERPIES